MPPSLKSLGIEQEGVPILKDMLQAHQALLEIKQAHATEAAPGSPVATLFAVRVMGAGRKGAKGPQKLEIKPHHTMRYVVF
jgi:hypothetical protein